MIKIFDESLLKMSEILARSENDLGNVEEIVANIISDVKLRGDEALFSYGLRFDGVLLKSLKVSDDEIDDAFEKADVDYINLLTKVKENIEAFHRLQLRTGFNYQPEDGIVLGQKITPIAKAGLYVPGGTACYPSSVLMNAIPAKVAGVSEIIMTTPPQKDGSIKKEILIAAKIAGIQSIYKVGGAQAIAALAYGTKSISRVDKIVGPGNIFVATAKKLVSGDVGIDMIAGPSEILVIADSSARAQIVAADMLSQAEHDKLSTAILLTDNMVLAGEVQVEIEKQLVTLPRQDIARASINSNGKIIVCNNIDKCIEIANLIAPEHLELMTAKPFELLDKVKNAGSIFLGANSPEALGDYFAGANHTLPTNGTARFSSPLSVDDFIKKSQYIYYDRKHLLQAKSSIASFADSEGLSAHARSVKIRFGDSNE
ncbi:MAG: histidinol dehydrogenase [Clostridia bacterium]